MTPVTLCAICQAPLPARHKAGARQKLCSDTCKREANIISRRRYDAKKRAEKEALTGQPARSNRAGRQPRSAIERVLEKCVQEANGCWIYQGSRTGGYGRVGVQVDGAYRVRTTHRVTYEYFIGEIPDGLELDHYVCQRTACCNPWHLDPCTHLVNVQRQARCQAAS